MSDNRRYGNSRERPPLYSETNPHHASPILAREAKIAACSLRSIPARNGATLRLVAAPQIFVRSHERLPERASAEGVMNRRPATPAPRLIDRGMPKLYALDLSDLPDANTTDPADVSGNCGCIGIDVERRHNRRTLFRCNSIIAAARRDPGGKLDACFFGDLPNAGGTDAANPSGNCGSIGIDVERRDDLSAFIFGEFLSWHGRVTRIGLRNALRPHRRPMNALDGESQTRLGFDFPKSGTSTFRTSHHRRPV